MVLTTHYMEEAEQLCDRIAIMDQGQILVEGTPSELVAKLVGDQVLEIRPEPNERLRALDALHQLGLNVEEVDDTVFVFGRDGTRLHDLPGKLNLRLKGLIFRPASLEDVFLKLAGRGLKE